MSPVLLTEIFKTGIFGLSKTVKKLQGLHPRATICMPSWTIGWRRNGAVDGRIFVISDAISQSAHVQ